ASQAGVASGVASTSRQVGQSLGVALFGSILAVGVRGHPLGAGLASARFVPASHAAWLLLAGCGCAGALLGLITTRRLVPADQPEPGGDPGVLHPDLDRHVVSGAEHLAAIADRGVEDES